MKKLNLPGSIKTSFNKTKRVASKHSPEILLGLAIASGITSAIMIFKAAPKAKEVLDARLEELPKDAPMHKIIFEGGKAVIPVIWPSLLVGGMSIGLAVASCRISLKRTAAITTAYSISEAKLAEYQKKVIEKLGENKEKKIRDEIAKDRVENNPPPELNNEIVLPENKFLCYDSMSGRYFKSSRDELEKAQNELNRRLINENYISLNELYEEIGLTPIELGEDVGFNVGNDLIDMEFSSILTDNGTPCLVLDYRVCPRWDFRDLH